VIVVCPCADEEAEGFAKSLRTAGANHVPIRLSEAVPIVTPYLSLGPRPLDQAG
jgi:hypothetical protein